MSVFIFPCMVTVAAQENQAAQKTISGQSQTPSPPQPEQGIPKLQESIVVTGTYWPAPLNEVDRSVTLIDTQNTPSLFSHWVDYLKTQAYIDLRQRAPNDVQADVSIRGSSFGQTLIMVNGLRVDDAQTGHHDMDLPLPSAAINRIEVLRGAGSTLYGADAIGGAINFITGKPDTSELRVGAGVGNFGVNQQSLLGAFTGKAWDEQLVVERDFSSGFAPDRDDRSFSAFSTSEIDTRIGETGILLGFADKPYGANQFYGNFDSWERTKTWFGGVKQDLGPRTKLDLGFRRHTDEFILLRDQPQIYENNHATESWEVAIRREQPITDDVTLFLGGEGDQDSIHSNNLGSHVRSRGAVYADMDARILGRFSFSMGVRGEVFDSYAAQFNPSIAAGVGLTSGLRAKASVSRAFRLPTYTDLYYSDPANAGNPNLRPESAWSFEGGIEWNAGGRFTATATAFQNREHNIIDYAKCGTSLIGCSYNPPDVYHATNIQNLNFTGAELTAEIRLRKEQRITASYSGIHGTKPALDGIVSRYAFNYPVNNAVVGWQGSLPGQLLARTQIRVIQRFARDPYALWDVGISRQFRNIQAGIMFSNLTSSRYEEVDGVAQPGRSAFLRLEYSVVRKKKPVSTP